MRENTEHLLGCCGWMGTFALVSVECCRCVSHGHAWAAGLNSSMISVRLAAHHICVRSRRGLTCSLALQPHSISNITALNTSEAVVQTQGRVTMGMTVGCIHDLYPNKLRYIVKTKVGL